MSNNNFPTTESSVEGDKPYHPGDNDDCGPDCDYPRFCPRVTEDAEPKKRPTRHLLDLPRGFQAWTLSIAQQYQLVYIDVPPKWMPPAKQVKFHYVNGARVIEFPERNEQCQNCICSFGSCRLAKPAETAVILTHTVNCYTHRELVAMVKAHKAVYVVPLPFARTPTPYFNLGSFNFAFKIDLDTVDVTLTRDLYSRLCYLHLHRWMFEANDSFVDYPEETVLVREFVEVETCKVSFGKKLQQALPAMKLVLSSESPLDLSNRVQAEALRPSHFSELHGTYSWSSIKADPNDPIRVAFISTSKVNVETIKSFGPFWYVTVAQHTVRIPRFVLKTLIFEVIGKPREPLTYTFLLQKCKDLLASVNDPFEPECVIFAASMAFTATLDLESNVASAMVRENHEKFADHKAAYAFTPMHTKLRRNLLIVSGVVTGLSIAGLVLYHNKHLSDAFRIAYRYFKPLPVAEPQAGLYEVLKRMDEPTMAKLILKDQVFATSPARVIACSPMVEQHPIEYMKSYVPVGTAAIFWYTCSQTPVIGDYEYPVGTLVPNSKNVAPPKYPFTPTKEQWIRPLKTQPKTSSALYKVLGFTFNGHVAQPFHLDQNAALNSFYRLMLDPPELTLPSVIAEEMDAQIKQLAPIINLYWPNYSFNDWVKRYTRKQQVIFKEALKKVTENGWKERQYGLYKHFVKLEKSIFICIFGCPRPIISNSPERLSITGPYFLNLAGAIKTYFTPDKTYETGFYYASGTAEQCGLALQNILDGIVRAGGKPHRKQWSIVMGDDGISLLYENGEVIFVSSDSSRHDGHVKKLQLEAENRLYKQCHMTKLVWLAIRETTARVFSRNMIVARVISRLSGLAQTSIGNSIQIKMILEYATRGGPDVELMRERAEYLGYRVVFAISYRLSDMEFCSKLFWPTADGLVLGAKIGRFLKKYGTMRITAHTEEDYKASILSALNDNYFVPIVSSVLKRTLQLLAHVKLGKVDKDEEYKHHVERRHQMTDETWFMLHDRYGISHLQVAQLEEKLKCVNSLPFNLEIPWFDALVRRDD
jgi:hypothetical protein